MTQTEGRGLRKRTGKEGEEYIKAKKEYSQHPLSSDKLDLLSKLCGGIGPKHLIPQAKLAVQAGHGRIPKLSRLAMRQKYALLAWFSVNWDLIFSSGIRWPRLNASTVLKLMPKKKRPRPANSKVEPKPETNVAPPPSNNNPALPQDNNDDPNIFSDGSDWWDFTATDI